MHCGYDIAILTINNTYTVHVAIPSEEEALALAAVFTGGIIGTPPSSLQRASKATTNIVDSTTFSKGGVHTTPLRHHVSMKTSPRSTEGTVNQSSSVGGNHSDRSRNNDHSMYDYFTKTVGEYNSQSRDLELLEQEVNMQVNDYKPCVTHLPPSHPPTFNNTHNIYSSISTRNF